jgi:predicted nucleic acid-binding protein
VTRIVIDASAGAEILVGSLKGRALARLAPAGTEGWVPEHFYAEVLAAIRRQNIVQGTLTDRRAAAAVSRLARWHLHRASLDALVEEAWRYRHAMSMADALYVALATHLGADFLTSDDRLVRSHAFPSSIRVVRLPGLS